MTLADDWGYLYGEEQAPVVSAPLSDRARCALDLLRLHGRMTHKQLRLAMMRSNKTVTKALRELEAGGIVAVRPWVRNPRIPLVTLIHDPEATNSVVVKPG